MFQVTETLTEGAKLQQINHPFWSGEEIRNDIRNVVVQGTGLQKDYIVDRENDETQRLRVTAKTLMGDTGNEKQILLMVKET